MSSIQAVPVTNVQCVQQQPVVTPKKEIRYVLQMPTAQEDKNFIEGLMWGVNGVQNVLGGIGSVGATLFLDTLAIGVASQVPPEQALVGAVGLIAINVLAFYVAKAEFSIAGKSFTHMKNTIL